MRYMGSKSRIVKYLVPIIQGYIDKTNVENYIEPFVGGANVIDKIKCKNKYASDNQYYLIELYNNLDNLKELPTFVTKEHYSEVRKSYNTQDKKFEDWYIGAIGFLASYNGRFFDGGYSGLVKTKSGNIRNYYDEAKRNLEQQSKNLNDIKFKHCDYSDINKFLKGFVIYCDPPYKGTKQYGSSKNFHHDNFWEWVRYMSKNNIVLVSECQAPKDFKVIWEQEVLRTVDNTKRIKSTEKLYVFNG